MSCECCKQTVWVVQLSAPVMNSINCRKLSRLIYLSWIEVSAELSDSYLPRCLPRAPIVELFHHPIANDECCFLWYGFWYFSTCNPSHCDLSLISGVIYRPIGLYAFTRGQLADWEKKLAHCGAHWAQEYIVPSFRSGDATNVVLSLYFSFVAKYLLIHKKTFGTFFLQVTDHRSSTKPNKRKELQPTQLLSSKWRNRTSRPCGLRKSPALLFTMQSVAKYLKTMPLQVSVELRPSGCEPVRS